MLAGRAFGAVAILLIGCVPMQQETGFAAPPAEGFRCAMTAGLALRIEEASVVLRFQAPPRGACSGACRGAALGAAVVLAGAGSGQGAGAALALTPLFALGGGLYGLAAALPADVVDASLAALEAAAREARAGRVLAGRLVENTRRRGGPPLDSPEPSMILSIAAPELVLSGPWTLDPDLRFRASVDVRLCAAAGGEELFRVRFGYSGRTMGLRDWAAEGALKFRDDLRHAGEVLGRDVSDVLFFTVPMEPRP